MKKGEIWQWNGFPVAVTGMEGPNVSIKLINNPGKGNRYTVALKELSKKPRFIPSQPSRNGCPNCGLYPWNYRSGVECPACHYIEESMSFRRYIETLEKKGIIGSLKK